MFHVRTVPGQGSASLQFDSQSKNPIGLQPYPQKPSWHLPQFHLRNKGTTGAQTGHERTCLSATKSQRQGIQGTQQDPGAPNVIICALLLETIHEILHQVIVLHLDAEIQRHLKGAERCSDLELAGRKKKNTVCASSAPNKSIICWFLLG